MQRYYKQIHDMPPLSEQEMNAHLAEESRVRGAGLLGLGACAASPHHGLRAQGQRACCGWQHEPGTGREAAGSSCLDRRWREQTRKDILPQISRHKLHLT